MLLVYYSLYDNNPTGKYIISFLTVSLIDSFFTFRSGEFVFYMS